MSIKKRIAEVIETIPSGVTLIAVSKTRSVEEIKEAYEEGLRDFGENKVQEIVDKIPYFPEETRWHLIGHLQTNKIKYIVGKVHLIHSLDSIKLLKEIEKHFSAKDCVANVLIQVNIGKEESKTGIDVEDLNDLIEACEQCSHVKVKGLMAIIPQGDEEQCRNYFRKMKEIFEEIKKTQYKNISMEQLSLGMTGDYKLAISEGSTMVRIGEGIFGKRKYNNN